MAHAHQKALVVPSIETVRTQLVMKQLAHYDCMYMDVYS